MQRPPDPESPSAQRDRLVGARLRARRIQLGVTQVMLAEAIGVTFQQLQKYESGGNRISASRLYAAACALRTRIDRFFDELPFDAHTSGGAAIEPTVAAFLEDPDRHVLARCMLSLSSRERRAVTALVRALIDKTEE
jgi:transcriptional regulator with XRE-family HTH domain